MKVFSNTTPFIALCSIGQLELLPKLFGAIHVALEVIEECAEGGLIVVPPLRQFDWIIPVEVSNQRPTTMLLELDKGEKATLLAAAEHQAKLVLIDEKIGRNLAEYLGLRVMGTLGVLLLARKANLIHSFTDASIQMQQKGIHFSTALIKRLAVTVGE